MSFWSTLGKVGGAIGGIGAAPFTGGASLLPTLGKLGLGIGGSLLASKLGKSKPSPLEQQVTAQNQEVQRRSMDLSTDLSGRGKNLISMGESSMAGPANYWSGILSGNQGRVTSALSPELMRIAEGYKAARASSSALMPRGGARADALAQLPFQQQRDASTLMQRARPEAATNLFNAGQGYLGAGSGLLSNATQALYNATQAGRDLMTTERDRLSRDTETGRSLGSSIFDIISNLNLGKGGGGGKKLESFSF